MSGGVVYYITRHNTALSDGVVYYITRHNTALSDGVVYYITRHNTALVRLPQKTCSILYDFLAINADLR
jgi:hypothetical protein